VFDSIILGARQWLPLAIAMVVVVTTLAVWSYFSRGLFTWSRTLGLLLKIVAVVALAACLLEPMQRSERPRPGANIVAVVVDNSRSMEIKPPGETKNRIDQMRPGLESDSSWQARLGQDFDVRRYAFDDRLRAVDNLASLDFSGNNSSLADSIQTIQSRFASRSVAGMILFTDGLATDDMQRLLAENDYPFPLYPVIFNAAAELRDLSISDASVVMSSFELAPASVEATVAAQGLSGNEISVKLVDMTGKVLDRQLVDCDSDEFQRRVRFQFQPSEPGFQLVRLQALLASEDRGADELKSRTEVTTANNSRLLAVDRGGGPYRILYVSGRPNWEFKFLRRALEQDIELVFHGLVRIAKKEPKFTFQDRGVQTTNPLIAGFSEDEETAEQYDEPVLIRIGEGAGDALKAGFPSGAEELFSYHAIILDDVEADFFTQQQMLLMREFVAARGGGLLMLGGQESFLGGGYRDTPLGDVLPVYLRGDDSEYDKTQMVRYRLTREGALEPWLRLRPNQADEQTRFEQMPDFLTWNAVADVKPGASLLAEISTASGDVPGLVSQRFGRGRALALTVGDFWRWSMRRATEDADDLAQSWRQIARWLTADVPRQVEIEIREPANALDPHVLTVQLRDASFKPLDNATVSLTVFEPDGQKVSATAVADVARPGYYLSEYWSSLDGGYRCEIEAITPDGEELPAVMTGWTAQPSAEEFARVEPDVDILKQLAERSKGELVPADDLAAFVSTLPTRKVPVTELRIEPLWHRPWLILLALGCLCGEWGLRRWKGLP
jgi:uncharacterized membrane protein